MSKYSVLVHAELRKELRANKSFLFLCNYLAHGLGRHSGQADTVAVTSYESTVHVRVGHLVIPNFGTMRYDGMVVSPAYIHCAVYPHKVPRNSRIQLLGYERDLYDFSGQRIVRYRDAGFRAIQMLLEHLAKWPDNHTLNVYR